jgi:PPOX class probable FMN-dependent enzyme
VSAMERPESVSFVSNVEELREVIPLPPKMINMKVLRALDVHCRNYIARSPFLALGTFSPSGNADVSPRGDQPGFVRVLDDRTLLIPERPGNRLLDSLQNILSHPRAGLLFLIPGIDETLRVNGRARITRDEKLLAASAVDDKAPKLGIWVDVEECFLHCAKAFRRSRLWHPATFVPREELPTLGQMILDQTNPGGRFNKLGAKLADRMIERDAKKNLY